MSIERNNYLIGRSEINVGALVTDIIQQNTIKITEYVEHLGYKGIIEITGTIEYPRSISVRKTAFEELLCGKAKDSLFTSDRYQIEKKDSTEEPSKSFRIEHSSNIGELLKLLNYGESLSGNQLYFFMLKMSNDLYFQRITQLCGYKKVKGELVYNENEDRVGKDVYETISRIRKLPIKPCIKEPNYDDIKRRR